MLKEIEKKFI